jgi:hypothetical protein
MPTTFGRKTARDGEANVAAGFMMAVTKKGEKKPARSRGLAAGQSAVMAAERMTAFTALAGR